jgi:hypothetical protein
VEVLRKVLADRPVHMQALSPGWELEKDRGDRVR